ncbi:MAG: hypothetical protein AB1796_09370 [Bacillota bacterium]
MLTAKFGEVEMGLDETMAVSQAGRCLQCDLRQYLAGPILPPVSYLEFCKEIIETVPAIEGVYQLFDENNTMIWTTYFKSKQGR